MKVTRSQLVDPIWCAANHEARRRALRDGTLEIVEGDGPSPPAAVPGKFYATRAQMVDPLWCAANDGRRREALKAGTLEIVDRLPPPAVDPPPRATPPAPAPPPRRSGPKPAEIDDIDFDLQLEIEDELIDAEVRRLIGDDIDLD